ncbi:acyl carrier protein [Promicromonospora sp. Populi]|uniref:acyl carrier protein n=1 Tax=Promicromonospora sp. Populi TaxID=3239420 RepID=UPI0034E2B2DE
MATLDDTTKILVKNLIGDILELSPASLSTTSNLVEDHGADPLAMARIITALEKTLRITIDYGDIQRLVTLQGTYDIVVEARARMGEPQSAADTGDEPMPAAPPQEQPRRRSPPAEQDAVSADHTLVVTAPWPSSGQTNDLNSSVSPTSAPRIRRA